MTNTYNNLEEYIQQLLKRINIHHPHQLDFENISNRLAIQVHKLPMKAMCVPGNIILDSRKTDRENWEDFGHELFHALWHAGDQALMPFSMREYHE